MNENILFKIGDHILQINYPADFVIRKYLPSFKDFFVNALDLKIDEKPLIMINVRYDKMPEISEQPKVLSESSETWGEGFSFLEVSDYYITTMKSLEMDSKVVMTSIKDFTHSTIYLGMTDESQYQLLSWFIMVVYGQAVLPYNTVMIHASVVENKQEGAYAFLGKSGTGKSTHSQLWIKYLEGFELLNDDNPVIRVFDNDEVFIYGTPWSGKTHCYRNLKLKLKGMVRLQQGNENNFIMKHNAESMIMLLPSCTAIRWNKVLFNNMVDTAQLITNIIPIGLLDCLINKEAAILSYNNIKSKSLNYE